MELWKRVDRKNGMLIVVMMQIELLAKWIQELKGDLLDLTQMMKDHEVSIKHLEERMHLLASQMESRESMISQEQIKKDTTPTPNNVDKDDIEWDVEEMFFKETLEDVLLNIDGRGSEG
ncbi:hypothetical protein HAX54_023049 [Datura stramonium]|uniref:Uncharacterized protein n=1 Tax=Datura stramonium TaxID=4076 RepID=A0ABS8S5G9_DATST|nr:hypothetical protein [Datura stramonium]